MHIHRFFSCTLYVVLPNQSSTAHLLGHKWYLIRGYFCRKILFSTPSNSFPFANKWLLQKAISWSESRHFIVCSVELELFWFAAFLWRKLQYFCLFFFFTACVVARLSSPFHVDICSVENTDTYRSRGNWYLASFSICKYTTIQWNWINKADVLKRNILCYNVNNLFSWLKDGDTHNSSAATL